MRIDTLTDHAKGIWHLLSLPLRREQADGGMACSEMAAKSRQVERAEGLAGPEIDVVTWNVFAGRMPSFMPALEDLASSGAALLLQEAPVREGRGLWDAPPLTRHHAYYVPDNIIERPDEFYDFSHSGNAVLAPYSLHAHEAIRLPRTTRVAEPGTRQSENCAYARIETGAGRRVGLCSVHLDFESTPSGRAAQARYLVSRLHEMRDDAQVVGMDANALFAPLGLEPALAVMREAGYIDVLPHLFRFPYFVDRIFVRGDARVVDAHRLSYAGSSDHQPMRVRIAL